jgi:flagellar biosynthesis anti-sigma factor FlgM
MGNNVKVILITEENIMEIRDSSYRSQNPNTTENVKRNENTKFTEPSQQSTPAQAPKEIKNEVALEDEQEYKVRNPQLDLNVHYSVGRSTSSDRVTISAKAKEISALRSAVSKLPDLRDNKVQKYTQAIEEDNYKVKSNAVAGRMLDEM